MNASAKPRAPLKPLDDALADLLAHAAPLAGTDTVATFDADGRVLAQHCTSALHVPPQDNSSMDGYAVRCAAITAPGTVLPVPQPGQWIRRAGEDITRGAVVLAAGTRLSPAELGLAASIGLHQLQVARRPRVALFSTGDELVMPGDVPPEQMRPGAIYNSNRFFLRAMLLRLGCEVTDFGIVPDRRDATVEALRD